MQRQHTNRPVVLIVSAREDSRDLYGDWFTSIGFNVMTAGNLAGALWVTGRYALRLVVVDLTPDGPAGLETLRRLREPADVPGVPTIALTSYAGVATDAQARASGATDVVPHLANFNLFHDRVRLIIHRLTQSHSRLH